MQVFATWALFAMPVSQFILPPGQAAPGGQPVPGYLAPNLVIFTPGGQAVQAGLSCPPPNTSKNIYMLFCYFSCIILMNSDPPYVIKWEIGACGVNIGKTIYKLFSIILNKNIKIKWF